MASKDDFGIKRAIFGPQQTTKTIKITFSFKLHFLHLLAKFKQKIAQISKNMTKKVKLALLGPFWGVNFFLLEYFL